MNKVVTALTFVLLASCIEQDPCRDITCSTTCKGEDLWEQQCVNGACVDYQIVEENAVQCGYDPCKSRICGNKCYSTDMWKMKCVNGECVRDVIVEKNARECGFIPPPITVPPIKMLGALETEEYAVYKTVIEDGFYLLATWGEYEEAQLIIINDHTAIGYLGSYWNEDLDGALEYMVKKMSGLT